MMPQPVRKCLRGLQEITRSMFYVGQVLWGDIKNSWKYMGQLMAISKTVWD